MHISARNAALRWERLPGARNMNSAGGFVRSVRRN